MAALSTNLVWDQAKTKWASELNPLLANALNSIQVLQSIVLTTGANTINHKLGRNPQGWFIVDINAAVTIYRSQPFNDTTLTLTSSGAATVSIGVY